MTARAFTLHSARCFLAGFIGPPLPLDGEVEHLGSAASRPSPQSNDLDIDDRGLIYLTDGVDMLELRR